MVGPPSTKHIRCVHVSVPFLIAIMMVLGLIPRLGRWYIALLIAICLE